MNPVYTLITGASHGIGKALAEECGKQGMNLLLVALPQTGLKDVADNLREKHGVDIKVYEADLTIREQIEALYNYITSKNIRLNALINNAGVGYEGAFENLSPAFCEKMMQLNTQAVVMLTRLFIDNLKQSERAYIMNMSSISAFTIVPYKSMYNASKAFIYSFSRGLREELKNTSISVSVLCPGPIITNDFVRERIKSHGGAASLATIEANVLAESAIRSMLKRKAVIYPGTWNKVTRLLTRILPERVQIMIMARKFSKVNKAEPKKDLAAA
jgi:uncharacterized protein